MAITSSITSANLAQLILSMKSLLESVDPSVGNMKSTAHQRESASADQATISSEEPADSALPIQNTTFL